MDLENLNKKETHETDAKFSTKLNFPYENDGYKNPRTLDILR